MIVAHSRLFTVNPTKFHSTNLSGRQSGLRPTFAILRLNCVDCTCICTIHRILLCSFYILTNHMFALHNFRFATINEILCKTNQTSARLPAFCRICPGLTQNYDRHFDVASSYIMVAHWFLRFPRIQHPTASNQHTHRSRCLVYVLYSKTDCLLLRCGCLWCHKKSAEYRAYEIIGWMYNGRECCEK